jgi:hypothetical protein
VNIATAHIHVLGGRATMRVTLEDGTEQDAISWYVDELTFTPQDAIGRTVEEPARVAPPARPRLPPILSSQPARA